MSNAWFYYVFPLGISVVFVIAAVVLRRRAVRGERNAKGETHGLGAGRSSIFIGGIGGTLGLAILLTSPTPWQRERLFDHVFRTPPESIERFVIRPGSAKQYKPLTQSSVVIDDAARIQRIAGMLRTSREVFAESSTREVDRHRGDGNTRWDLLFQRLCHGAGRCQRHTRQGSIDEGRGRMERRRRPR